MTAPLGSDRDPPTIAGRIDAPPVILASASRSRAHVLRQAGIPFTQQPGNVDEDAVKRSLAAKQTPVAEIAARLAELKANNVSRDHASALVIGADQILDCAGTQFDKPVDRIGARSHLLALRGRSHDLVTSVCLVETGECIWQHTARATLTMRDVSEDFIDRYLDALCDRALASVGAYQLEGLGAQLFSRVEGDFFTILGLPLLPLLAILRERGVVAT